MLVRVEEENVSIYRCCVPLIPLLTSVTEANITGMLRLLIPFVRRLRSGCANMGISGLEERRSGRWLSRDGEGGRRECRLLRRRGSGMIPGRGVGGTSGTMGRQLHSGGDQWVVEENGGGSFCWSKQKVIEV